MTERRIFNVYVERTVTVTRTEVAELEIEAQCEGEARQEAEKLALAEAGDDPRWWTFDENFAVQNTNLLKAEELEETSCQE